MGSRQNQVRSRLGRLARFSYERIIFFKSFFKEGEILPRRASPPNRASSAPYEQHLNSEQIRLMFYIDYLQCVVNCILD